MMRLTAALLLVCLFGANAVWGYEQSTHALITARAFEASNLVATRESVAGSTIQSLGLNILFAMQENYFELIDRLDGLAAIEHQSDTFERSMSARFGVRVAINPYQTWLMYGAIREDDNPSEDPPTPQDVNPGLLRPLNHFFDPYFDRPLTAPGVVLLEGDIHTNPDWAIGAFDSFIDANRPEPQRKNHFTVLDAREAMFRALTLMTLNGTGYTDIAKDVDSTTREQWRRAYWATAFRALGNVLHMNQDMAQPQHTRNEPHSGVGCPPGSSVCAAGHTSIYEKYIKARTLEQTTFNSLAPFNVPLPIPIAPLEMEPTAIPDFASYTDYWSTSRGTAALPGHGLADYSNRGFFTAAKNFDSNEYPLPSRDPGRYVVAGFTPSKWDGTPAADSTPAYVYYGEVNDDWQQTTAATVPLTTYSLWDQFIRQRKSEPAYTLNRVNYDAMASLLIPRAVAYSAGLINFFFRGRIDIELPDEGVFAAADHSNDKGFTAIRAKIRNKTPPFVDRFRQAQPQDMSGGQFFAVIRFHKDKQYVGGLDTVVGTSPCTDPAAVINASKPERSTLCRDAVEQIVVSRPLYGVSLSANEQKLVEFEFDEAPIPFEMTDVVLQVVYRGELGSEADAVAVGTIDISEPSYFAYHNASDYIHIDGHVYTRGDVNGSIDLLTKVQPQGCVDYRKSPPQLVDGCLDPFQLDLAVSFGDVTTPVAAVTGLPAHRFIRLAYLTVSDEGFNPPVKSDRRSLRVDARPRVRAPTPVGKALLNQDGTCIPHDPFNIPPRHAQLWVVPPGTVYYQLGLFGSLRGVNGWFSASCVINGDDSTPGAPDDRASVMTPLTPQTEEVVPYRLTIMPAYL